MVIYANSADRSVYLEVPVTASGSMDVMVKRDGVVVYTVPTVYPYSGGYYFTLPFFLSQEDAEFTVEWKFPYVENGTTYTYQRENKITVVTPYVAISTLTDLFGAELSNEEIIRAERAVRNVINAHCGQTFGRFTGVKQAVGTGENTLALPARLISFSEITTTTPGLDLYGSFDISGDGWYIKPRTFGAEGYNIKAEHSDYPVGVNGVIYNPYGRRAGIFPRDIRYSIDGVWGYEYVPEAVQEAATLLVNDYAGPDSAYRDRYLESLTSPDWRIQFHSGAFQRTGNVRADQLLSDYVLKRGWAVI